MAHEVDADDGDCRELKIENGRPVHKNSDEDDDSEGTECHG